MKSSGGKFMAKDNKQFDRGLYDKPPQRDRNICPAPSQSVRGTPEDIDDKINKPLFLDQIKYSGKVFNTPP